MKQNSGKIPTDLKGLRILLVDDHPVVRRGVRQILAEEVPSAQFGEAQNAGEAIELLQSGTWNVLILDISLKGRGGLDVLADVKSNWPNLPVLVLSMHPADQYAVRVMKAGASGFMTKESAPEELVNAVKKLVKGQKYISPGIAERLVLAATQNEGDLSPGSLSDRELEVLKMLSAGMRGIEIAKTLSLSYKTISSYRQRLLQKLGLKTNADLFEYASNNKLL